MIALRETNNRQHKCFDQTLAKVRDELKSSFNSFAADTQRAYQELRQETHGEKRFSLDLLNELLESARTCEHIVAATAAAWTTRRRSKRWTEAVEVESRKVQTRSLQHGIQAYEAVSARRTTPPCTSASAASASRAWGRSWSPRSASAATPASSRSSSCDGPR